MATRTAPSLGISRALARHENQERARSRLLSGASGDDTESSSSSSAAEPAQDEDEEEEAEEEVQDEEKESVFTCKRKSAGGNVYHIHFH